MNTKGRVFRSPLGNLGQTASGDTDGDGLSNTFEVQLGTNPTSVDTDNDGMEYKARYKGTGL